MRRLAMLFVLCGSMAGAQTDFSVPAEFPPDDYAGRQYVDSRGCAYVRAGVDGAVNWLPRVNRDRKPLCGLEPSVVSAASAAPAVAPVAVATTSVVAAQAASEPLTAVPSAAASMAKTTTITVPPGFSRVWEDDRLNPRRAQGTAAGEAAMQRIWTNDVPRKLITAPVSTSSNTYVEVATFSSKAQRDAVVSDLRRQGLPARRGVIQRGASETPAVLLGPYGSRDAAPPGLQAAQSLGYSAARIY